MVHFPVLYLKVSSLSIFMVAFETSAALRTSTDGWWSGVDRASLGLDTGLPMERNRIWQPENLPLGLLGRARLLNSSGETRYDRLASPWEEVCHQQVQQRILLGMRGGALHIFCQDSIHFPEWLGKVLGLRNEVSSLSNWV